MSEPIQLDIEIAILKETIKQQQEEIHNLQLKLKEKSDDRYTETILQERAVLSGFCG